MNKITVIVADVLTIGIKFPSIVAYKENGVPIQFPWFCVSNYASLPPDILTADGYPQIGCKLYLEEKDGRFYPDGDHYILRRSPLGVTSKSTRHMSEESLRENLVSFAPQSLAQLWECIYKYIPNMTGDSIREAFEICRLPDNKQRERLNELLKTLNITEFIPLQEDVDVEFKSSFIYTAQNSKKDRMMQYHKIFNTICAMANSEKHQGCIYVGVNDRGEILDLSSEMLNDLEFNTRNDFEADFKNILGLYIKNDGSLAQSIQFVWCQHNGKIFCNIIIPEYKGSIVYAGPSLSVYVRQGSSTRQLLGPELANYIAKRMTS